MKIAIRADASPAMGSGHVMRCLALADALVARGARVRFICRSLPEHLAAAIREGGHALATLSLTAPRGGEAPQAAWPDPHQLEDAHATRAALDGFDADWTVVDHYGLDSHWEQEIRSPAVRIMAIDDLARSHRCDLVLDANFNPEPHARYEQSASAGAQLLLGPRFALLRPEFAQARAALAPRGGPVWRLLVCMGGSDAGNATGRVLQAIELLAAPGPQLDVVIGAGHPARTAIEAFCAARPGTACHVQTSAMAKLLAGCELAVGAAGGASWERCCLGVPTLTLALSENQRTVLPRAARAGLVYAPDSDSCALPEAGVLATHLKALIGNSALREAISAAGMALVDGRGAQRVAAALYASQVTVRPADSQDCDLLHAWRNTPAVRETSRNTGEIPLAAHRAWFEQTMRSPDRLLLVGEDPQGAVGAVRFDLDGNGAEVSIYLAEPRLGQGLGPGLLRAGENWLARHAPDVSIVRAETLAGNEASRRLFEQCGYRAEAHRFSKKIGTP